MSSDSDAETEPSEPSSQNQKEVKKRHEIGTSLSAGALAGALAKTTIAPLDRTKIHFQVSTTRRYSFKAALKFVKLSWRTEGPLSLWRGNSATMARVAPFAAIQFTAHEQWRKLLLVDADKTSTPVRRFLAGSLAGFTATICTYPLDLARARLAISPRSTFRSLCSVFSYIWRKEGCLALYRGLSSTLLGSVIYSGCSFYTFESLKLMHKEHYGAGVISPFESFLFGAVAGVVGQSTSYPLDIVRRRKQTGVVEAGEWAPGVLLRVARSEGIIRGVYKGLSMNWVKGPIAAGISFATFDTVVRFLRLLPVFRHPP